MRSSQRSTFKALVSTAVILVSMVVSAEQRRQQDVDLQAAIRTETVDGDLKTAIKQYEAIATKYSADRVIAATALVHMAECYQKLGDTEAHKIFERILREYGDQKEAADIARAQLEGTHRAAAATLRQVWTGPKVDTYGSISPDGHLLSFADWTNHGALGIHDLVTGADRLLTNGGEAEYSTISKDGAKVAYSWFKPDTWRYEVRLANLTGDPKPRQVYDNVEVSDISPYDWSPDGKWIAVGVHRVDHTAQIGLLSSETGVLKVLKSVDWRGATRMFFSPDGRFLAYDVPAGAADSQRDVYILAVDGSREIAAVVNPNQDLVMGWSTGMLLFASDRSGSVGLWGLPFRDGQIQGPPEMLKANLGTFQSPLGLSASGALFFGRTAQTADVQVIPVDWTAGTLAGAPVDIVKRFVGSNYAPSWSSDGKFLGYISRQDLTRVLPILNVDTGKIQAEIRPRMSFVSDAQLSPDGRTFLAEGTDLKGRRGIFLLAPETGDVKPVALSNEADGSGRPDQLGSPDWSPDGRRVYFVKISGKGNPGSLVEKDLASGAERELIGRQGLGVIRISPDGRWLATVAVDAAAASRSVVLIPLDSGAPPRDLFRPKSGKDVRVQGWTPDSRSVVVSEISAGGANQSRPTDLWSVPVGEGAPHKLDMNLDSLRSMREVRISPDGRYIAYFTGGPSIREVSVLENFLPKAGSK